VINLWVLPSINALRTIISLPLCLVSTTGQGKDTASKHKHFQRVFGTAPPGENNSCMTGLVEIQNAGKALADIYGKPGIPTTIQLDDLLGVGAISYLSQLPKFAIYVSLLLRSKKALNIGDILSEVLAEES
jgi:hypothetical protein